MMRPVRFSSTETPESVGIGVALVEVLQWTPGALCVLEKASSQFSGFFGTEFS